jgi:hypothetical protein
MTELTSRGWCVVLVAKDKKLSGPFIHSIIIAIALILTEGQKFWIKQSKSNLFRFLTILSISYIPLYS